MSRPIYCPDCHFPYDSKGFCSSANCPGNESIDEDDEDYCYYCGEPLDENGLCSVACQASAADEGREKEGEEEDESL